VSSEIQHICVVATLCTHDGDARTVTHGARELAHDRQTARHSRRSTRAVTCCRGGPPARACFPGVYDADSARPQAVAGRLGARQERAIEVCVVVVRGRGGKCTWRPARAGRKRRVSHGRLQCKCRRHCTPTAPNPPPRCGAGATAPPCVLESVWGTLSVRGLWAHESNSMNRETSQKLLTEFCTTPAHVDHGVTCAIPARGGSLNAYKLTKRSRRSAQCPG
jgi:hypothetical protein